MKPISVFLVVAFTLPGRFGFSQIFLPQPYYPHPSNWDQPQSQIQQDVWVLDSIYCYQWEQAQGQNLLQSRTVNHETTPEGTVLVSQTDLRVGNTWVPSELTMNDFDEDGFIASQTRLSWDTTIRAWYYEKRTLFSYDSQNRLSELLFQVYDRDATRWTNQFLQSYAYATFNRPISLLKQDWVSGAWQNDYQISYTLNNLGDEIGNLYQDWNVSTAAWVNVNRSTDSFNGNNQRVQTLREKWNNSTAAWVNNSRTTYSYNQNDLLEISLQENWQASDQTWVKSSDQVLAYNQNGQPVEFLTRIWNGLSMINFYRVTRQYDLNGNLTENRNQTWTSGTWRTDSYCTYFYTLKNLTGTFRAPNLISCSIPNPIAPGAVFSCDQLDQLNPDAILVFNQMGHLVAESRYEKNLVIPAHLLPGAYILAARKKGKIIGTLRFITL